MATMTKNKQSSDRLRAAVRQGMESKGTNPYAVTRACQMHDDQLRGWLSGRRRMIRSDLLERVLDHLDAGVEVDG